ncbi:hypothetical protein D3C76_1814400 [compost metagenome]
MRRVRQPSSGTGTRELGASSVPLPALAKAVGLMVSTLTGAELATLAMALPA